MKYKGKIKKVKFSNNGWAVIYVELDNKSVVKACGTIAEPVEGYEIEFDGEEEVNSYGPQIKVSSSRIIRSKTKSGIIAYLTSGLVKGIGPVTAEAMYAKYKDETVDVLRKDKNKLLEFKGITPAKADVIYESLKENSQFENLCKLCGSLTYNQGNKIIEKYGDDAEKVLKKNPYNLIYDINGFGFKKVDAIAKSLGIKEESPYRIGAALVYILKELSDTDGHCFSDIEYLSVEAIKLISPMPDGLAPARKENKFFSDICDASNDWSVEREKFFKKYKIKEEDEKLLDAWVEKRDRILSIIADVLLDEVEAGHLYIEDGTRIYHREMYDAECTCAEVLAKLVNGHCIKTISRSDIAEGIKQTEEDSGYSLGEEQKKAIIMGLSNRISIITGGPGRGKTTIIKTILDIWGSDEDVVLCAPTGRAAQRMKESTQRNADTIHRTMRQENPEGKLIIIDECSMIDVRLGAQILSWCSKLDNNVIFVGDIDQLPSIGPGSFFRDMIVSNVIPTTFLKQGYRNDGSIAKNAERINSGKTLKHLVRDNDFIFKDTPKEEIQEEIKNTYMELRKKYDEKDICILTPMRQRSRSGSDIINEVIRNIVNPFDPKNPRLLDCKFRLGDRVMQTRNNQRKEVYKNGLIQYGVYNGDCGKITEVDPYTDSLTIEFDDGRSALYYKNETDDLVLSYAMTIHKSQGSEYPAVIIANSKEHYIMLQRNLLYTAETRAKNVVVIIGDPYAITMAVNNTEYKERNTRLRSRLIENVTAKK